ncbi:MAG: hypothetical protein LBP26_05605 [Clostridiales bacterium]|nr:hypothetical protein [Clostridiales bacterium]
MFKDDSTEVVAYFSLAMSGVTFSENVPDKIKRKLMYGMTNKKYAPAYLIAQIGKDDAYADEKIGEYLLTAAMEAIQNARNYIGGRFVYVECKPTLRAYYEKLGFTYLQTAQNNLLQMFQVL